MARLAGLDGAWKLEIGLIFGRPMDEPGPEFEISESELTEMHRFVRHDVIPRFYKFFPIQQRGIA